MVGTVVGTAFWLVPPTTKTGSRRPRSCQLGPGTHHSNHHGISTWGQHELPWGLIWLLTRGAALGVRGFRSEKPWWVPCPESTPLGQTDQSLWEKQTYRTFLLETFDTYDKAEPRTVSNQKSSPQKNLPPLGLSSGFNFWALPPWHARF